MKTCLLYTSDAADEARSVDLGGRSIIKKKKIRDIRHIGERKQTGVYHRYKRRSLTIRGRAT
ncbi:hypothetical protein PVA38_09420 [Streptococcus pneumoniae D39]|nr:hypothetical protein PVA38_09420 [Streptococcus pneumoniae D39]